ncbi:MULTISPECIES: arylsulfatase [unclassified Variovorax]|uniref:arylsulfatase n=2 Tax=unclassified Variovorax TaxID=663243 RepID=UPI00210CC174|nr:MULTISPECIES: arylsulfatase [unclassified Variovorax]
MKMRMSMGWLLAALLCTAPPAQAATGQPNIVLVLMDNLGYGEPGVYGGGITRGAATPRIDALAQQGTRLTNFNVEAQCTPSRAALMTGRYAVRTGNGSVPLDTPLYGLTQWEVTIAEALSAKGYATAAYGKWHLGHTEGRFPTDQGFDEWYGIPNSSDESYWSGNPLVDGKAVHPYARPEYLMEGRKGADPKQVKVYDLEQRALIDGELTRRGIDFMRRQSQAGKPFFLYLPLTQPHYPTLPGPEFKGKTGNGDFADVLAQTDAYVGRLIDAVDQIGQRDNTIFIFTSDNGPEMFLPNIGSSGPWRGTYFTGLEGSLRVPFILRWPGKVPAGTVSNEIVHEMDVFPTLARWTGAEVPKDRVIDGVDQGDFLLGKAQKSGREGFVVYVGNEIYGIKWRNWKMMSKEVGTGYGEPVRSYGVPLFYNLLTDPKEEHAADPRVLENFWVRFPAVQVLTEHMKSLKQEPPVRPGTPDPYRPAQ